MGVVEEKMRKKEEADKQAAADARFAVGRAPEPGIPEGGPSSGSGLPRLDEENLEMMEEDDVRGQKRGPGDDDEAAKLSLVGTSPRSKNMTFHNC